MQILSILCLVLVLFMACDKSSDDSIPEGAYITSPQSGATYVINYAWNDNTDCFNGNPYQFETTDSLELSVSCNLPGGTVEAVVFKRGVNQSTGSQVATIAPQSQTFNVRVRPSPSTYENHNGTFTGIEVTNEDFYYQVMATAGDGSEWQSPEILLHQEKRFDRPVSVAPEEPALGFRSYDAPYVRFEYCDTAWNDTDLRLKGYNELGQQVDNIDIRDDFPSFGVEVDEGHSYRFVLVASNDFGETPSDTVRFDAPFVPN